MKIFITLPVILMQAVALGDDLGPIATRNHRATSLPFLRLEPRSVILKRNEREWSIGFTVANDFRQLSNTGPLAVEEDQETKRLDLNFRKGLAGGKELHIALPMVLRDGGVLDGFIEWWHTAVIRFPTGRSNVPRGRSVVFDQRNGSHGDALGIGDLSGDMTWNLPHRQKIRLGVKLPTGNPNGLIGSGGLDLAADWQGSWTSGKWTLHAQAGAVFQGRSALKGAIRLVDQESLALVYSNRSEGWVLQWQGEASPLITGVDASDAAHRTLTMGYKKRLNGQRTLELFLTEDRDFVSAVTKVGPDLTLGARLSVRF